jgi:hypothetical protein
MEVTVYPFSFRESLAHRNAGAMRYVRGKTGTEIDFHAALRENPENPDSPGNPLVNGQKGVYVMHVIIHYRSPEG